jgi:hypothetical protein
MAEPCGHDRDWWKAPMAAGLARKKAASMPKGMAKPGDTFLIVTKGTVTEPVYFKHLLKDIQLYAVTVKVIPGDASDPRRVINTAYNAAREQPKLFRKGLLGLKEPASFDHVWAVIDTDVAVRMDYWNDLQQVAEARKVKLAHSTPCFEFWLLLHFGYTTRGDLVDGEAAKGAFKKAIGRDYSTNRKVAESVMPSLIPHWPQAVTHAERVRRHHQAVATPEPANPSTEVELLIRALNDAAPEHARRL